MRMSTYFQVVKKLEELPFDLEVCLREVSACFPGEDVRVLRSLICQWLQRQVKKISHTFDKERKREILADYEQRVAEGLPVGVIAGIAVERRFSAALTAKIVLEEWTKAEHRRTGNHELVVNKLELRNQFRNPHVISNKRLSLEVSHANSKDENYGPLAEYAKHSVGQDFEAYLHNRILDLNVEFLDENEQRKRGFDKTPDIKLEVPIVVDGCVVNWIESKAFFGDAENHAAYISNQLHYYWNRFGPGMVIYWFGYIEDLKKDSQHSAILIADSFPDASRIKFFQPGLQPNVGRDQQISQPDEANDLGNKESA